MKFNLIFTLFLLILILTASKEPPVQMDGSGKPGFRVRSDFAAALNSEEGWAGALNENVTV